VFKARPKQSKCETEMPLISCRAFPGVAVLGRSNRWSSLVPPVRRRFVCCVSTVPLDKLIARCPAAPHWLCMHQTRVELLQKCSVSLLGSMFYLSVSLLSRPAASRQRTLCFPSAFGGSQVHATAHAPWKLSPWLPKSSRGSKLSHDLSSNNSLTTTLQVQIQ
jgi:hypothetical protein